MLQEAAAVLEQHRPVSYEFARALNYLGQAFTGTGDPVGALACHLESLYLRRMLFPDGHPRLAIGLNNLAIAYSALGDSETAYTLLEEAIAIHRANVGNDHPLMATALRSYLACACSARTTRYFT